MTRKKHDEFETRAKLQEVNKVHSAYRDTFEKVHIEKRRTLYWELISGYRENKSEKELMRLVGRLSALEDIDGEFKGLMNSSKKYEKRLKEIENDREEENERNVFEQYHGG